MPHSQLTTEQRFKIQTFLELSLTQIEIAERLRVTQSTISREIKNNSYLDGTYQAQHASKLSRERRKNGKRNTKKLVKNKYLRRVVIDALKHKRSPEQITGIRKRKKKEYVVHETIYQYIYTERRDLIPLLRQKKGKYRRRHGTKIRGIRRELAKKTWITERPDEVNERIKLGHWEGDTVRGKDNSGSISTHVERVSGYALGSKLEKNTAFELHKKTVRQFQKIEAAKRKSVTNDNGLEFSDWELTERVLGMKTYFALPYHSWERGTNENFNGPLRQFFPKGTSFATVTQKDVDRALRNLNHRPRKRLNYLSPYEVFVKGLKP